MISVYSYIPTQKQLATILLLVVLCCIVLKLTYYTILNIMLTSNICLYKKEKGKDLYWPLPIMLAYSGYFQVPIVCSNYADTIGWSLTTLISTFIILSGVLTRGLKRLMNVYIKLYFIALIYAHQNYYIVYMAALYTLCSELCNLHFVELCSRSKAVLYHNCIAVAAWTQEFWEGLIFQIDTNL